MEVLCDKCNTRMELVMKKNLGRKINTTASDLANTSIATPYTYSTTTEIPYNGETYKEPEPLRVDEFICPNCSYKKTDLIS